MSNPVPNAALPSDSPIDSVNESPSELSLFTALLVKGEESAWARFFDRYRLRLLGYLARTWRGEPASLDDLLQETLIRVVRHVKIFHAEDEFWCWLTVLARSAVSDHGRRRSRWGRFLRRWKFEAELRATPGDEDRFAEELTRAMERLDPDSRSLLEAKYYHGQTVRALSRERGLSEKAIEARLARARQRLGKLLTKNLKNS